MTGHVFNEGTVLLPVAPLSPLGTHRCRKPVPCLPVAEVADAHPGATSNLSNRQRPLFVSSDMEPRKATHSDSLDLLKLIGQEGSWCLANFTSSKKHSVASTTAPVGTDGPGGKGQPARAWTPGCSFLSVVVAMRPTPWQKPKEYAPHAPCVLAAWLSRSPPTNNSGSGAAATKTTSGGSAVSVVPSVGAAWSTRRFRVPPARSRRTTGGRPQATALASVLSPFCHGRRGPRSDCRKRRRCGGDGDRCGGRPFDGTG
jgi:hypothetical protein